MTLRSPTSPTTPAIWGCDALKYSFCAERHSDNSDRLHQRRSDLAQY
jgi:hypothetical protein